MVNIVPLTKSKYAGLRLLVLSVAVLMLSACGSTKVYNNDKTIVYNDNIFNVSSVKQIGTEVTAKLADDSTVDLTDANKKKVQSLLKKTDQCSSR